MSDSIEQKPAVDEVAAAPAVPQLEEQQVDTPATEPEEDAKSKRVTLADLSAKGTRLYGNKQYDEAADIFARAAELQAEINGDEINPDNAEILFLYGRSLFKVGQSKSDVLGGKAPVESKPEKLKKKATTAPAAAAEESKTDAEKVTQEGVAAVAEATSGAPQPETTDGKKPLFQFEGDENFDQSDEEEVRLGGSCRRTPLLIMHRAMTPTRRRQKRRRTTCRSRTIFSRSPASRTRSTSTSSPRRMPNLPTRARRFPRVTMR